MTKALKCRSNAQLSGTLTQAAGLIYSRIQAAAGGRTTDGSAGQLTPTLAALDAPAHQQLSKGNSTGAPKLVRWGHRREAPLYRYPSASWRLLALVFLLLGGAAANPPPEAGCASSSTQRGGSATGATAGGPLGVTGACPVSLLNLLALQRLALSGVGSTTEGDADEACGAWACGLVQSVLPATVALSRLPEQQNAAGPSAGGSTQSLGTRTLGRAAQHSAVGSTLETFAPQPATAPVSAAGDRRDVERTVVQLIRACTGPLALQLALSVSEAAGPTEPSWRSPTTDQDGRSAGSIAGSGLAAGVTEILQRMALCPLDTDIVAACLEAVPGYEPPSASAGGLLGMGPDSASRVALGAAAAAQTSSVRLGSFVQQSTWSFSSESPRALYGYPQTCGGQPPQVSYKGPGEPQQQQAALGSATDRNAGLLDGAGACVGGVAAAAPVTWTAGCACSRTWEPLCHVATGVQYPNRCYAACQGVDNQAVRPCLELFQPSAGLAAPRAGPAASAPLAGVGPPSPSIPGDASSRSGGPRSGHEGDDARQVLTAMFAAAVGAVPHAGMQQSAEQRTPGLQAWQPMSIFMASGSGQQQQQPPADRNPRMAPAGPTGSHARGPGAIGADGADTGPGADDEPYGARARVAALLRLLLLPAVQELGGQGYDLGNVALATQPSGLGLDRAGASTGPGRSEAKGAAGMEGMDTADGSDGDAVHSVVGGGEGQGVPEGAAPLDRLIYLLHLLLAAQKLDEQNK